VPGVRGWLMCMRTGQVVTLTSPAWPGLQDAQAGGVGEGRKWSGSSFARVLEKHKGCFISQSKA